MTAIGVAVNNKILQQLESISKKLSSPTGLALNEEEGQMMQKLRQKPGTSLHLHAVEQFFANNTVFPS